ncbi:Hpt domain-containing protein, partial [Stenotrophomonas pictorum]
MSTLRDAMSHAALGWVKPELDETLRLVRNEVEYFVEDPSDTSRMRFCAGYLHQVQGTLRMVELYAPAMVAEELESLANAVRDGAVPDRDEACATLMRGTVLLPDYLERLQNGHRDIPIVLLPLLNEIRSARGAEGINESVLFAFNPDAGDASPAELEHARGSLSGRNRELLDTVGSAVKEELLRIKDALDLHMRMGGAPADLQTQVSELGAVADTLGVMGLGVARGVVVQQRDALREVVAGTRAIDDNLLLDIAGALLYVDASLDDQVAYLGANLQGDEDPGAVETRRTVEILAHEAIANFAAAREAFVAFIETNWDHERLREVPRLLGEVAGALRMLDLQTPADYLHGVQQYIDIELIGRKRIPGGRQLDTLADAMASLEYYLEALRERRAGRGEILEITRNSLEALRYWPVPSAASAELPDSPVPEGGGDEVAPTNVVAAAEPADTPAVSADPPTAVEPLDVSPELPARAVYPLVYAEAITGKAVAAVEPPPLPFGEQDSPASPFDPVAAEEDPAVQSASYTLAPIVLEGAGSGLDEIASPELETFHFHAAGHNQTASPSQRDTLLDAGAGMDVDLALVEDNTATEEQPVYTFDSGPWQLDEVPSPTVEPVVECIETMAVDSGPFELEAAAPGPEEAEPQPPVLDVVPLQSFAPAWEILDDTIHATPAVESPDDSAPVPRMDKMGKNAVASALAIALGDVSSTPADADAAAAGDAGSPEDIEVAAFMAELNAAADAFDPFAAPATDVQPAETSAESVPVHGPVLEGGFEDGADEIDQDIRDVFIEEFDEELVNLGNLLPVWRASPGNVERLRPVRRVFHTLKGSGRLVGARTLGEFSWKIESMLNRVLDGSRPASPAVVAMVNQAYEVLPQLNAALRGTGTIRADLLAIQDVADRVAAGEEAFYAPVVATSTPAVSAGPASGVVEIVEGTPASVDSVLREILEAEVAQHLATVHDWLDQAQVQPQPVTEELLRAVHTMSGAFAMTDVPEITSVTAPMESFVKRSLVAGLTPGGDAVQALREAAAAVSTTISALQQPSPLIPSFAALAARLEALVDTLPEAKWPPVVDETFEEDRLAGDVAADGLGVAGNGARVELEHTAAELGGVQDLSAYFDPGFLVDAPDAAAAAAPEIGQPTPPVEPNAPLAEAFAPSLVDGTDLSSDTLLLDVHSEQAVIEEIDAGIEMPVREEGGDVVASSNSDSDLSVPREDLTALEPEVETAGTVLQPDPPVEQDSAVDAPDAHDAPAPSLAEASGLVGEDAAGESDGVEAVDAPAQDVAFATSPAVSVADVAMPPQVDDLPLPAADEETALGEPELLQPLAADATESERDQEAIEVSAESLDSDVDAITLEAEAEA